jgi:hypothetical protein
MCKNKPIYAFICSFLLMVIVCITLIQGVLYLSNSQRVIEKDATGEVIDMEMIYDDGPFRHIIRYILTLNTTRGNICTMTDNENSYMLHQMVTGLYVYSNDVCSVSCTSDDCRYKTGLGLTITGSIFGFAAILMFVYGCCILYKKRKDSLHITGASYFTMS